MPLSVQLSLDLQSDEPETALHGVPIDTAFLEEDANRLARLESFNKHLYRPNTYLHKWWARRCGATFRYILKQLVPQPGRLSFYEPGGLEGKIVFDYVVFSENPISVHIRALKALKHDTILVLKPRGNEGDSEPPAWSRPATIDTTDSYRFCLDCGLALGWFLAVPLSESHIRRGWKSLMEESRDGEAVESSTIQQAQPSRPPLACWPMGALRSWTGFNHLLKILRQAG